MKKKILLAVCALTAVTAASVGLMACGDKELSADDAAAKIATFTTTPNTVNATFKQTFKLVVNDERESFKSFEKDVDDTVTVQVDYTAGNVYYYGKKVAKDNSVEEQLVVKEGDKYSFLTTTTAKASLSDEAAAKAKIDELMKSLTRQTSGYVDGKAFVYSKDWVHTYLLLDSGTLTGSEKSSFTYSYKSGEKDGLKVGIDMKYVGYYGDMGTFEFGTDATHTGARADIVTDAKGYVTSFSQTFNNHLDMNITSPAIPLDLTGTRSLTAEYNGTLTRKAITDITQNLPTTSDIKVGSVEHATVSTYDFKNGDYSTLAKPSAVVTEGNFVAVKVECEEGYEVKSVKVNDLDTQLMNGYYCLMQAATAGTTYNVTVVVGAVGQEAPKTTVTVNKVTGATVKVKGLFFNTMTYRDGAVEPGEFICIHIIPDAEHANYTADVLLGGKALTDMTANWQAAGNEGMLFCYMDFSVEGRGAAVAGGVYDVTVALKEKVTVNVNTVEGATINVKGLTYIPGNLQYRDGAVVVGEFICIQVILDDAHAGYTVSAKVDGVAMTDMSANWEGEGKLLCYMPIVDGRPAATTSGTTYNIVVTLSAAN